MQIHAQQTNEQQVALAKKQCLNKLTFVLLIKNDIKIVGFNG